MHVPKVSRGLGIDTVTGAFVGISDDYVMWAIRST